MLCLRRSSNGIKYFHTNFIQTSKEKDGIRDVLSLPILALKSMLYPVLCCAVLW